MELAWSEVNSSRNVSSSTNGGEFEKTKASAPPDDFTAKPPRASAGLLENRQTYAEDADPMLRLTRGSQRSGSELTILEACHDDFYPGGSTVSQVLVPSTLESPNSLKGDRPCFNSS